MGVSFLQRSAEIMAVATVTAQVFIDPNNGLNLLKARLVGECVIL